MRLFLVLLRKEFTELWRNKKLFILLIVFLFFAISSPIIAKLIPSLLKNLPAAGISIVIPEPSYKDAIDQFVKNISQLGMFILIFVFAGSIAEERSKKTLELLLVKPVSRGSFILAKYKASFLALLLTMILASLVFYSYTVSVFTSFSFVNFIEMAGLIYLFISLIVSATIFASTLFNNTIIAAGSGLIFYIFFSTIDSITDKLKAYSPYQLAARYKEVIAAGWNPDFLWPIIVCLGLILLFVSCSIIFFRQQEIER